MTAAEAIAASRPRHPHAHLVDGHLLLSDGSQLYGLGAPLEAEVTRALAGSTDLAALLAAHGLRPRPPRIDDTPLEAPPLHALSLAVAQRCNLACTYCYAGQGSFGAPAKAMPQAVALQAVDRLVDGAAPGARLTLAFLGGEPLANRAVLRAATHHAATRAAARGVSLGFSITTNGTLVTPDDADFFAAHGFAVTVSLDGPREAHDRQRPMKNGKGSFDRIMARLHPLLAHQGRMQVSARVTVTPANLDLVETLDLLIGLGFHSVGFSPMLASPTGAGEMDERSLEAMLDAMIACGRATERALAEGRRYPFSNLLNALREIERGTHRPYPCGAGAGYLGVSADGDLAACHRFVGSEAGAMGSLARGIDRAAQTRWLAGRHVHTQAPCGQCWARYLCGGGCHHEVLARGRPACDYIRGWLHYCIGAFLRLDAAGLLAPAARAA